LSGLEDKTLELQDRLIYVNRVAKVVKGGRRFSFSALVVVGDGNGRVGYGMGKANEVPDAIRKAINKAKKELMSFPLVNGTIPHEVVAKYGASKILLKPAREGTGVIAGKIVRDIMEVAGVKNVVSKCFGSRNHHNVVKATFECLSALKTRTGKDGISEDKVD